MSQKVPSKKKQATAKRIISAIHDAHGLITNAAEKAGVDRRTVSRYMKEFPKIAQAVEDAQEKLYDTAESKLIERIEAGDLTAIIFFLKTRCKRRGYIERQEYTGKDGKELVFRITYDDPPINHG